MRVGISCVSDSVATNEAKWMTRKRQGSQGQQVRALGASIACFRVDENSHRALHCTGSTDRRQLCSSLRQPRRIKHVVGIPGAFEDDNTFVAFNCETGLIR